MNYFKKMDSFAVTGIKFPVHSREYYLTKIKFVERPRYSTPLEVSFAVEYINRGLFDDSVLGETVAYFQNNQTGKNTLHYCSEGNIVRSPCERLQNLAYYCQYNNGLANLSLDDLQYIYSWLV